MFIISTKVVLIPILLNFNKLKNINTKLEKDIKKMKNKIHQVIKVLLRNYLPGCRKYQILVFNKEIKTKIEFKKI